jgi:hypothetical protein
MIPGQCSIPTVLDGSSTLLPLCIEATLAQEPHLQNFNDKKLEDTKCLGDKGSCRVALSG